MVFNEPDELPVVRSLARCLEMEPLSSVIRLGRASREAEFVVLVILIDQVLDNSARLPESDPRVRVLDGWEAPVGVDRRVLWFLDVGKWRIDQFIGEMEFV